MGIEGEEGGWDGGRRRGMKGVHGGRRGREREEGEMVATILL